MAKNDEKETELQEKTYILIDDIAKLFGLYVGRAVQRKKMSYGHRKLLMCLSHGREVDQLQLTEEANLTSSSVSTELARMQADGYVQRRFDPDDQRKFLVQITENGMERHRLISGKSDEIEERMLKGLSRKEREQLTLLLKKILENLGKEEEMTNEAV